MVETSISDLLCERASLQPNDTAFTFIDYEQDWDGVGESVTWSHLRRARSHLGGLQLARCRRRGSGLW
jgi:acyl-CoA synthetase (AMP-forming)/AMP-acid ligase II